MKNLTSILLVFAAVAAVFTACNITEEISDIPEISFESVAPSTVTEYQDSLVFNISYRDGNGDLGENNTDNDNLFIQDSRNSVTYGFRIQQLAPNDADIAIQGNLSITLPNTAIVNDGASETVSYTIWIVDRAGNESNKVTSSSVTVNAQ